MTVPKAVLVRSFGKPENFTLEELEPKAPGTGEVCVELRSCGVSFLDGLITSGGYQVKPPLPYVPGTEAAGVITAVGVGVSPARIGERVAVMGFDGGGLAQAITVAAERVRRIPDPFSFDEASIFRVSYGTAYYALVQRARLLPGETLLVMGASGAVGYAAIQVGKALGAKVITSASTSAKRDFALAAGADCAIDAGACDWRGQLVAANGGRGIDVVVDPVGGSASEQAFRSLAWNGRHLVIGYASGAIPAIRSNLALLKGAALIGVDYRQFCLIEPDLAGENDQQLDTLAMRGMLKPPVGTIYPIEDFADALNAAAGGNSLGRVVVDLRGAPWCTVKATAPDDDEAASGVG